jgi:hypothetical protein
MAKAPPPASNRTFAQDGLTVRHIENRLPLQKGLTTAHLGQALGSSAASTDREPTSHPATPPAAEAPQQKK